MGDRARVAAELAATLADTEVTSAPGQPQLLGNELPQAPRWQGRLGLDYERASALECQPRGALCRRAV